MIDESHILTDRSQLRQIVGEAPPAMQVKSIDHIDEICARYIAASPFLLIATRRADGQIDVSPKGDPPGFVGILDEKTLAIPERLGNGRFDTFENIFDNPEVGLIFLIPGHGDTLRVTGRGRISNDPKLCARFAVNDKNPRFVLLVKVESAMTHCPKCVIRSALWQPEKWPDRSSLPTLAEATMKHADLYRMRTLEQMQEIIDQDRENRLY